MDKTKQLTEQKSDQSITPIQFFGTLAQDALLLLIVSYFLITTLQLPGTLVSYVAVGLFGAILLITIASVILTILRRQELATKLALFMTLIFGIAAIALFQGRILTASFSVFFIGIIAVTWMFPQALKRRYYIITVAAFGLMWIIEWINPQWRIQSQAAAVGPTAAILFGVILGAALIYQAWNFIASRLRSYSLGTKLTGAFILVTTIAIVILSIISNITAGTQLTAQVGHSLEVLTQSVAHQIADGIDNDINAVTVLSLNKALQENIERLNLIRTSNVTLINNIDKAWQKAQDSDALIQGVINNELSVELKEFQAAFPQFIEVFATDKYGSIATATARTSDYYQADEEWWQKAWNGGKGAVYISTIPSFDESTQSYAIDVALPITAHNNPEELVGVLRVTLDINRFAELIATTKVGETGQADLIFPDGQVLSSKELGLTVHDQQTTANLAGLSDSFEQKTYEGVLSLVNKKSVSAPTSRNKDIINQLGWAIVIHQDFSEATAPVSAARNANIVVVIIITIVTGFIATRFAQFIAVPLTRLTAVAQQVAEGNISAKAVVESEDEVGILASTFNVMTSRLQEFIATLEQRVADRTQNLELAAKVGRAVSEVRALDVMLEDAADLIRSNFDLYYVQVYLVDRAQAVLHLESGTGTVGQELLARRHSLPLNTDSINGRAAITKRSVVISNTTASATFRPNPLLPDTRSEMAIPLIVGEKVVGVLDLQSTQAGSLNEDDLPAFEALAGQLAVAIQNATLVSEAEQARAEVEKQAQKLVRANWQEYLDAIHKQEYTGYVFDGKEVSPISESQVAMESAALTAPIAVSGEALGAFHVEIDEQRQTPYATELVNTVARQVAQQLENLRLLDSAERYRTEVEQNIRRQTREGWQEYIETRSEEGLGYQYDLKEIKPLGKDVQPAAEEGITLPLKIREESIGQLSIQGISPNDEEAITLANEVIRRLTTHLESLRQFEETKRGQLELDKRASQLAAVAEVSTVSSRELDIEKMLESVVRLTQRRFGLYHAHIFTYNNIAGELVIAACGWKEGDEHEGTHGTTTISLEQEQSLVARAGRSRQAVIVNDVRNEPGWLPNPMLPDTRAEVAVPLVIGDQLLGVLDVQADKTNSFSQEDANIFSTLASQVATALQNARSFAQAQQQAEREAMLNTINQKIQSATSVEAVLQIAARELGHALGASRTIAQLSMKEK
jgi:GAF domain-containing protein/HAMP domain-containing protein